jgi:hypothetical protein
MLLFSPQLKSPYRLLFIHFSLVPNRVSIHTPRAQNQLGDQILALEDTFLVASAFNHFNLRATPESGKHPEFTQE